MNLNYYTMDQIVRDMQSARRSEATTNRRWKQLRDAARKLNKVSK